MLTTATGINGDFAPTRNHQVFGLHSQLHLLTRGSRFCSIGIQKQHADAVVLGQFYACALGSLAQKAVWFLQQ